MITRPREINRPASKSEASRNAGRPREIPNDNQEAYINCGTCPQVLPPHAWSNSCFAVKSFWLYLEEYIWEFCYFWRFLFSNHSTCFLLMNWPASHDPQCAISERNQIPILRQLRYSRKVWPSSWVLSEVLTSTSHSHRFLQPIEHSTSNYKLPIMKHSGPGSSYLSHITGHYLPYPPGSLNT